MHPGIGNELCHPRPLRLAQRHAKMPTTSFFFANGSAVPMESRRYQCIASNHPEMVSCQVDQGAIVISMCNGPLRRRRHQVKSSQDRRDGAGGNWSSSNLSLKLQFLNPQMRLTKNSTALRRSTRWLHLLATLATKTNVTTMITSSRTSPPNARQSLDEVRFHSTTSVEAREASFFQQHLVSPTQHNNPRWR